jgi:hypothetical protein
VAEKYLSDGFTNVRALRGGYEAWLKESAVRRSRRIA